MPSDKLMRLFIIQALSSFVSRDYDSGLHYLNEIKQTFAQHMTTMNPTLKSLAKEIIQSLDLFEPGNTAEDLSVIDPEQAAVTTSSPATAETSTANIVEEEAIVNEPTSVASELQELLERRRARKAKRKE